MIYLSKIPDLFSNRKRKRACIFVPIFKKNFKLSHIPQRTEKDCLNCGAIVHGKYCHVCGQENIVPKETFWHMVTHFFYDVTHFDSNFFHTVHHLIFKPGFLSREYMSGKRASYLHPIRMYVFSSAIFFLLFFSVFQGEIMSTSSNKPLTLQERNDYIKRLQEKLTVDTGNSKIKSMLILAKDSSGVIMSKDTITGSETEPIISFTDENYKTIEEYDSIQRSLPPAMRDGWMWRRLVKKQIEINTRYKDNPDEAEEKFTKSILHRLPYMLFVSLPLFALILKLVYVRRKQFYFADHGVFTIHLYVFTFIMLIVIFGFGEMDTLTGWNIWGILSGLLFLSLFVYLFLAMKRFYKQGGWKTFAKFLIVTILSLVMMLVLLVLFMFFSAVTF